MAQLRYRVETPLGLPFWRWAKGAFRRLAQYADHDYLLRYGPESHIVGFLRRTLVRLYLTAPRADMADRAFSCYHIYDGTRDEHEWLDGFAPSPTLSLTKEAEDG